jgi:hypothetical protein
VKHELAGPEKGQQLEQVPVGTAVVGDIGCSGQDSLVAGRIEMGAYIVAEVEAKVVAVVDGAVLPGTHHVETEE